MGAPRDERKHSDPGSGEEEGIAYEDGRAYETDGLLQKESDSDTKVWTAVLQKNLSLQERITKSGALAASALRGLNGGVLLAILSYAVCSSSMLVVNKVSLLNLLKLLKPVLPLANLVF